MFAKLAILAVLVLALVAAANAQATVVLSTQGSYTMSKSGCQYGDCFRRYCGPTVLGQTPNCADLGLGGEVSSTPTCCQSQARWGGTTDANCDGFCSVYDFDYASSKSGLGFSGVAENNANQNGGTVVAPTAGVPFPLGTVTHFNRPIAGGTAATKGNFTLTLFNLNIGGVNQAAKPTYIFPLTIDETTNDPSQWSRGCPYSTVDYSKNPPVLVPGYKNDSTGASFPTGNDGCKNNARINSTFPYACQCSDRIYFDAITAAANSGGTVTVNGRNYRVEIVGFSSTASANSATTPSFVSQEGGQTWKYLFGRLVIDCPSCPPPKYVPSTATTCDCICPDRFPRGPADCPADYQWNTTTCVCDRLNNNCSISLAALNINADCEVGQCTQNSDGFFVGSVLPLASDSACRTSGKTNLCNYRCSLSSGRSSCIAVNVTATCTPATFCSTSVCNNKTSCTTGFKSSSTNCISSITNPDLCTPYRCAGNNGNCVKGTQTTCNSNYTLDTSSCTCVCKTSTPAGVTCPGGSAWDAATCGCKPTGACSVPDAELTSAGAPAADPNCETKVCNTADNTISFTPLNNGTACRNDSNLCNTYCLRYTATYGTRTYTRARCAGNRPTCPGTTDCKTASCDPSTGRCGVANNDDGSSCRPGAPDCDSYVCQGGQCQITRATCQGNQVLSAYPGCSCACPSTPTCQVDYVFDPIACQCKPTGVCTTQLKNLSPPLDSDCETSTCINSVLTVTKKSGSANACDGASLCDKRCMDVPTNSSRSQCTSNVIDCPSATTGCVFQQCNPSTGNCVDTSFSVGQACNVASPAACTVYACDASLTCTGTFQCDSALQPNGDDAACRAYGCDANEASNTYQQCIYTTKEATNCSSNLCAESSECVDGTCKTFTYDCASQEAVDANLPGAAATAPDCLARICKVNTTTNTAECAVDYYYDAGTPCPNANCRVNSVCDGEGVCKGEEDPKCSGGGDSRKAEIIGSAAAGGVLSVVGAGAVLFAAAGAGVLAWQVRRRKLLNFESWEAGTMSGATVSPLYVGSGNEHVNPLAEL